MLSYIAKVLQVVGVKLRIADAVAVLVIQTKLHRYQVELPKIYVMLL